MNRETNRRKSLIIDPLFQYKMIGSIVLFGALMTIISLAAWQWMSGQIFAFMETADLAPDQKLRFIDEFQHHSIVVVVLYACVLASSWILGLYFSNQVAGPIYNIRKTLERYSKGDHSARVRLRKKDHFQSLAEQINQLLDKK